MRCCCVPTVAVQIDDWKTFDVFKLAEATKGRPLAAVVKTVLVKLDLTKYFDMCKLDVFLRDLELKYPHNPYHNSTHAADVVQAVYKILTMVRASAAWAWTLDNSPGQMSADPDAHAVTLPSGSCCCSQRFLATE
jgi:hypothetical protein